MSPLRTFLLTATCAFVIASSEFAHHKQHLEEVQAKLKSLLEPKNKFPKSPFNVLKSLLRKKNGELHFTGAEFKNQCPGEQNESPRTTIKQNALATRIQAWEDQIVAVFPRYKKGLPVTAATTVIGCKDGSPIWSPVPCWEMHEEGHCDSLQSAVDIVVDGNDRAWILDSGRPCDSGGYCPPKVVAVDLSSNVILRQIDLVGLTCPESRVQYLAVEQTTSGRSFVYVTDATHNAIIVWDVMMAKGYRVVLPEVTTTGCKNGLRDVLYMVQVRHPDGSVLLVFTYLSSCVMFSIRTEFLRSMSDNGRIVARGIKPGKMVLLGSDGGASVYFRYFGHPEVYSWDTTQKFNEDNFEMVYEGNPPKFATSVAPDFDGGRMIVLESNYPDFVNGCADKGVNHTVTTLRLGKRKIGSLGLFGEKSKFLNFDDKLSDNKGISHSQFKSKILQLGKDGEWLENKSKSMSSDGNKGIPSHSYLKSKLSQLKEKLSGLKSVSRPNSCEIKSEMSKLLRLQDKLSRFAYKRI